MLKSEGIHLIYEAATVRASTKEKEERRETQMIISEDIIAVAVAVTVL